MFGHARYGDHGTADARSRGGETGVDTAIGSKPERRETTRGQRLLSLAALLVLTLGLLAGAASPADAAQRHRQPRAGHRTELNCRKPAAIRQGGRVVVSARTVRALCRLFGDGRAAGAAADGGQPDLAAGGGVGADVGARATDVGAQAFGDCVISYYSAYGEWVQGGDGAWWCLRDWYDASGSYYATTFASYDSPIVIDVYWDGSYVVVQA